MFCPECGFKIGEEDAMFCPECGTKIAEEPQCSCTSSRIEKSNNTQAVLLTNTYLLSKKLHITEALLQDELNAFIQRKQQCGVDYILIDAHNYTTKKKWGFGLTRTESLKGGESPLEYIRILTDLYEAQKCNGETPPGYLFIIGSHDIIPMLTIPHYKKSETFSDKDIDTDIIYAYSYSEDMIEQLMSEALFAEPQRYKVGRLPVGEDTTFDDLKHYLDRAIQYADGIPMTGAYAQCDPHWKHVSSRVAADGILMGWLRNLADKINPQCYFERLLLTPYIDNNNISQVFARNASFYYFNLHGSSGLSTTGYLGEYPPHRRHYVLGITPAHIATCTQANVVATESCYGARHIGMDATHSMLLSAIYANSLIFLGSSRIAWGSIDAALPVQPAAKSYADTMVEAFTKFMLQGYQAGVALALARRYTYQSNHATPERAATLIEFNLFGDPTLSFIPPNGAKSTSSEAQPMTIGSNSQRPYVVETIKDSGAEKPHSILEMVRQEVDTALAEIHKTVTEHLYSHYGLPQRDATAIYCITTSDGVKQLQFDFEESASDGNVAQYSAMCDEKGTVLAVIATK